MKDIINTLIGVTGFAVIYTFIVGLNMFAVFGFIYFGFWCARHFGVAL